MRETGVSIEFTSAEMDLITQSTSHTKFGDSRVSELVNDKVRAGEKLSEVEWELVHNELFFQYERFCCSDEAVANRIERLMEKIALNVCRGLTEGSSETFDRWRSRAGLPDVGLKPTSQESRIVAD